MVLEREQMPLHGRHVLNSSYPPSFLLQISTLPVLSPNLSCRTPNLSSTLKRRFDIGVCGAVRR